MPLTKRAVESPKTQGTAVQKATIAEINANSQALPSRLGGEHKAGDKAKAPLTKEGYWDRKEERDIQRDKDMAWSGLAQAGLNSAYVGQFNTEGTIDGLVKLVSETTAKLLKARDAYYND